MMKKCFAWFLILAAAAVLSGCALMPSSSGENSPAASPGASPAVSPTEEPAPTASPTAGPTAAPTQAPAGEAEPPDEAAVIAAYEKLTEFKEFWYEGGNSSAAFGEEIAENGVPYCRYATDRVKSFEDLKSLALTMVSQPLFEELQAQCTYMDQDGALYGPVSYGAGDHSGFVKNECEVVKISDTEFELKAGKYYNIQVLSEGEVVEKETLVGEDTCRYSLVDGKWVFTALSYENKSAAAG